ncbi:MAG: IS630 family transposase [Evtepia sp.]
MENDGRKTTGGALWERRKQAIRLWKSKAVKHTYSSIAELVGVTRQTVKKWIESWKDGGNSALVPKRRGRKTGTCRDLHEQQEQEIRTLIVDSCPDQLKLDFALWTRGAVQMLALEKTGKKIPIRTIGHYLARWGFTPQKPIRRAYARNEGKVSEWKAKEYPQIVKRAKQEDAEINWGDESGIRSDNVTGRSYAPSGKTPIQRVKGKPEKINMISAITNQGKVRFMFYRDTMDAARLICFMTRLIRDAKRKVFLILDNLRVHHSRYLAPWLEEHKDEIELFYLPSYSPDLNPDERMNSDLKSALSKKPDSRTKGRMEKDALAHMRSV